MESSVKSMTNFYRPLVWRSFKLKEISLNLLSEAKDKVRTNIDSVDNSIPVGIVDGAKRNEEFKQVLNLFDGMSLSNIGIIKKFEDKYWSNPSWRSSRTITPLEFELSADNELLLKQVDQLTQKCITELHRGKKYRIKTLSSIFSLDPFIIKRIIRRNARILAIKRKISKIFSRHRKLEDVHIDFIRQLLVNSKSNFLSIQSIKTKLLANFNEINDISEATVRRVVSKDLRFSFKKLEKIEPKTMTKDSIRSFLENSLILLEIQSWCKEVVYIDEFTVSSRHYSNYGCHQKELKVTWSTLRTTSKWVLF